MLSERELFISVVSNDKLVPSDIIVLLEGDGINRLKHSAWLKKSGFAPKICFSGGVTNLPYGSYPFEYYKPHLEECGLNENDFVIESTSLHTHQQAVEVIKLAEKHNWNKILLVASHFHQYRAYLTFLKEILIKRKTTILINSPARDLTWFDENSWGTRFALLSSEFEKTEKYMTTGHTATYQEAIKYQKWKERQLTTK